MQWGLAVLRIARSSSKLLIALALVWIAPAGAADSAAGAAGGELEEIIVTASKRTQSIRDVPAPVAVMTEKQLESLNASSFQDFVNSVPSLSSISAGIGQNTIVLRGVSTGLGLSATVGTYVDEVPVGGSTNFVLGRNSMDVNVFDLQRIEVLAGPQGTLYGTSTLGGLVKYVTNRPDVSRGEILAQGQYANVDGGGSAHYERGAFNIPLVEDRLALRVDGFSEHQPGFIDNPDRDLKNVDSAGFDGGRVSLLAKFDEDLSLRLTAMTQDLDRDGITEADRNPVTRKPTQGTYDQSVLFDEPFEQHLDLYSAVLDWNLSWASLTAVASWQKSSFAYSQDVTPLYGALLGTGNLFPFEVTTSDEVRKDYDEVRLTSRPGSKWDWQLGLFYTREEGTAINHVFNHFCADGSFPVPIATPPYLLCAGIPMFDGYVPSVYTEYGAYGDATLHITPALDLTLGIRYAYNKQDYEQQFTGLLNNPYDPLTPTVTKTHSNDSVVTYLFNPAYHLTKDSSIYLRIASGYRAGGPNLVFYDGSGNPNAPLSFGSDTIWSYDLGEKTVFLDGRLILDFSLFHVDWKDIQQFGVINGAGATINAGEAKIDGAELSGSYSIVEGLTISGFLSYLDARMAADAPVIGAQDGQRLPISPKFSGSLDVDYRFPLGGRTTGFVGLADRYVGDRNGGYDGSLQAPQYLLSGYNVIDGRFGVQWENFSAQLFVKNASNKAGEVSADMSNTTFNPTAPARVALIQPRTIGLQLTYDFSWQPK